MMAMRYYEFRTHLLSAKAQSFARYTVKVITIAVSIVSSERDEGSQG